LHNYFITLTFPSLWFLKQQEILSEVEKLYSVFNYLQQSAITTGKVKILEFNLENNSYSYKEVKNNNFDHNIITVDKNEKLSLNVKFSVINGIKGPPSTPTNYLNKPVTFIDNKVKFYSNGTIQPGTVYLTDSKKQYLYAITVPISQVSLIRKYKYLGKWILLE